jgi:UTP:GlnB (protein PII) uridylyltransferase
MPPEYAAVFGESDVRQHLAIAAARGTARAHAAAWRVASDGVVAACIVADDQPGLLSLIATALVIHRLDVSAAQIFCRERPDGRREAVDLFWLRSASALGTRAVTNHDLSQVADTLSELLLAHRHGVHVETPLPARADASVRLQPRVFFDVRALQRGQYVLVVEALDGPGLLLAITRALVGRGVETVASEIRTEDGIACDRFSLASSSGGPLTPDRLADVQRGVLKAVRELRSR